MNWEYNVLFLDTSGEAQSILDNLNEQGVDGWELVAVVPRESEISGHGLVAMFKRPQSAETEPWVGFGKDAPPDAS